MKQSYLIICSFMVAIAISSVSSGTTKYRKLIHEKCWPIRYKCKHLGQNPARWSEYDGGCRRWCKDEDFDGGLCMYGLNTGGLRDCWRCRCYTRDEPIKKPIIYGF